MTEIKEVGKYTFECLCKSVGYEINGSPAMQCKCHCESCRVYGGDAALVALFTPDQVTYTKGRDNMIDYEGFPGKHRMTCKTCGSWAQNILPNGAYVMPIGGLKTVTGPKLKPTMHIWVGDRGEMDAPSDTLPQHEGWPPM